MEPEIRQYRRTWKISNTWKEELEGELVNSSRIYAYTTWIKKFNTKSPSNQVSRIQRCCFASIKREMCKKPLGKAF